MVEQLILFEHPLTERMRLFLRVETLTKKLEHFRAQENAWDSSAAVNALVELFTLFERNDIKGEICKELERHTQRLTRLQGIEEINKQELQKILADLQHHAYVLQQSAGKFGQNLREEELLNCVRQRLTIPGGTCCFDTPAYYYWLHIPYTVRQTLFNHWLMPFMPLSNALQLILRLTRESAALHSEVAYQGFFQKNIEGGVSCPLIQIQLAKNLGLFPEISGGKYRISVRFWQFMPSPPHTTPCHADVNFQLRRCGV